MHFSPLQANIVAAVIAVFPLGLGRAFMCITLRSRLPFCNSQIGARPTECTTPSHWPQNQIQIPCHVPQPEPAIWILLTFQPNIPSVLLAVSTQQPLCSFQNAGVPTPAALVAWNELLWAFSMVDFSSFSYKLKTISSERHSVTTSLKVHSFLVSARGGTFILFPTYDNF